MYKLFAFSFTVLSITLFASNHHGASPLLPPSSSKEEGKPLAPVLTGLGDHQFPVSTKNKESQKFFNQGINLLIGFYNAQAMRSFQEAARLDPDCAMCWWGVAYAFGPNINQPMNPQLNGPALEALAKAHALAPKASAEERDWINALDSRYAADPNANRQKLDEAFAAAMGTLWKKYPNNLNAGTFYAEALMNTQPWDYWEIDGKTPKGHGAEIVSTLEDIIKQSPNHPGALHLYLHAMEASSIPERAEAAADRLGKLMPGVGHIVHMPSHIYFRVGRYDDAVRVNKLATKVDEDYVATTKAQGYYSPAYYGHNTTFLWSALLMLGEYQASMNAARSIITSINEVHMGDNAGPMEPFLFAPLATMLTFGKWNEILNEPIPSKSLVLVYAFDIFARGFAHANLKDLTAARKDRDTLLEISKGNLSSYGGFAGVAKSIINIAIEMLEGEISRVSGNLPDAITHFQAAQKIELSLPYMEPPVWFQPVSRVLGAALIEGGKPAEAEKAYRDSLQIYRLDPWALFGLYQSLEAQGKKDEAEKVKFEYEKAWKQADVKLTSSRF